MTDRPPLALVTGATRGIGRAVVLDLLGRGYRVIASGRTQEALDDLAASVGAAPLETALIDIESTAVADQVVAAVGDRTLDLLVASAARFAPWDETASAADLAAAEAVVKTNVFGTWAVIQAALPALRRADAATLIVVGSGSGSHGDPDFGLTANPGAVSYAVSKAALHALVRKLAGELAETTVRVFAVDPGLTATAPGMEAWGARPVEDGAASVLAPLDGAVAPGSFTRDGEPLPW